MKPTARDRRRLTAATAEDRGGFTLIEIMVVILILGLLATLVAPDFFEAADEAKIDTAKINCKTIYEQAEMYKQRNSKVPSIQDLTTEDEKGKTYLPNYAPDPWGNDYVIREGDRGKLEVISLGPDKVEGTEDDLSSKVQREK